MMHEIIDIDERSVAEKWNVGKLSAKLIAASYLDDESIYDLLRGDDYLSTSHADCIIQACNRLKSAKDNHEKVFVGGDYDADGICSTAIMKKTLDIFGIENGYYIPDRFKEGYGLSCNTVDLAYQKGYSIIMTVDNGVKAHDALKHAKELGMYVIVTDHHQIEEEIEADIVVHPDYMESEYAYLSGAGVALEISRNLIGTGSQYDELIALCAVALIGDVMPAWKETRKIIKKGLSIIKQNRVKALNSLLYPGSTIDETAISFQIVPKLNAIGRMDDNSNVNTLVPYLLSTDERVISVYAAQLNAVNEKRKKLSEKENKLAETLINEDKIQIISHDSFHEGICGLVAGRLANAYHKPFVVMANNGDIMKGSGRSVPGFNMFEFFSGFEELYAYGGHEQAVGISIKAEDYDCFVEHVESKIHQLHLEIPQIKKKAILIHTKDITFDSVADLSRLSPYPRNMVEPLFVIQDMNILSFKETPKSIRYELQSDSMELNAIVYKRKAIQIPEKPSGFVGKLQINRYKGNISLQLVVEEILQ